MTTAMPLEKLQRDDHDTLIRVETKLESLTQEIRTTNSTAQTITSDHESRIRLLENAIEVGRGIISGGKDNRRTLFEVMGVVASIITAIATYLLARH